MGTHEGGLGTRSRIDLKNLEGRGRWWFMTLKLRCKLCG